MECFTSIIADRTVATNRHDKDYHTRPTYYTSISRGDGVPRWSIGYSRWFLDRLMRRHGSSRPNIWPRQPREVRGHPYKHRPKQGFETGEMGFRGQFARQQSRTLDVRFGSKADIEAPPTDVRFTPKSRHGDVRLPRGSTRQNDRTALSTSGHDHAKQRWQWSLLRPPWWGWSRSRCLDVRHATSAAFKGIKLGQVAKSW